MFLGTPTRKGITLTNEHQKNGKLLLYDPCTVMAIYKCSKQIIYSGAIEMPKDMGVTIPEAQLILSSEHPQLPICL
jgi:hypothetical protein